MKTTIKLSSLAVAASGILLSAASVGEVNPSNNLPVPKVSELSSSAAFDAKELVKSLENSMQPSIKLGVTAGSYT